MKRYLQNIIQQDNTHKIILISGPRQCGKTTLSKALFKYYTYLNYDDADDRTAIRKKQWLREGMEAVIFDELHKMKGWKKWLKGLYDKEGEVGYPRIIVTGSANMDAFTKVGDSLAGRYFEFRLHPLDNKELAEWGPKKSTESALIDLLKLSGFPEPFLKGSEVFYRRWRKTHLDVILRQDFIDLTAIRSIKSIEILVDLLTSRVASPLSFSNLARDLEVDAKTIKTWLTMLENFYVLFKVTPYHHNIARAILKEPKFYFFDIPRAKGISKLYKNKDEGPRLENAVACSLLKEIHFLEDTQGFTAKLHYLRTRSGQEIDFLIVVEGKPIFCCEVKASDTEPSKALSSFQKMLGLKDAYQLVLHCPKEKEFDTPEGVHIRNVANFLSKFSLLDIISKDKDF
jgi:predicted AAA+ superfamily ATPase